jgi:predicted transcriptional regulator
MRGIGLHFARNLIMTAQKVTVELPEPIFQQLSRIAIATQQPIEALINQSIASNLPPTVDNAPPEIQAELLRMQTQSLEELQAIAQGQVLLEQQQRHTAFLEKNQTEILTSEERQELIDLRASADKLILKKAYAWSVLRWRGNRIPSLSELNP